MSQNKNILTVHTITPAEIPAGHDEQGYRQVVGVEHGERTVWLPGEHQEVTRSDFEIPEGDLGGNVLDYVEAHYGPDAKERYRNCHIGAASMTGFAFEKEVYAAANATKIIHDGEQVTDLAVGQWGVVGDRQWGAYHSMVGVAPGLALQTDNQNGPLSVVDIAQHVGRYQETDPDVALYAKHEPQP